MKEISQDKKFKYFITGGGTGGHIYPAIAVAKALMEESHTDEIYYIGNAKNLEMKIAHDAGLKFLSVDINSMPRKLNLKFLKWLFKLQFASLKAIFYVLKYKPNVVFGTGGYVSAPALIGALFTKTPYMIHDCDSHPGIVSRYASKFAQSVSLAFEEAKKFISSKNIIISGNPIREDFFNTEKETVKKEFFENDRSVILAVGGSQGALNINNAVINNLKYFLEDLKLNVILQTGQKNYEKVMNLLEANFPEFQNNKNFIIKPYFTNMAYPLTVCDLVISRAGSLSLSEIAATQTPAILVPYPYAAANHQRKNAKCFENAGAAIVIEDDELETDKFKNVIKTLITDKTKLFELANSTKKFANKNATKNIIEKLKSIAK